jgi:hypothetical protein
MVILFIDSPAFRKRKKYGTKSLIHLPPLSKCCARLYFHFALGDQQVYGRIVGVTKDLCTKAGAAVSTVNAEEFRPMPDGTGPFTRMPPNSPRKLNTIGAAF